MKEFYNDYFKLMHEKEIKIVEEKKIKKVLKHLPFRISAHYLDLIDWKNINCPIKLQVFPSISELNFNNRAFDFCHERDILKNDCLLQRYEDRVLLIASNQCFTYCRFCTRKWFLGKKRHRIATDKLDRALKYIENNRNIREVILSGGDPLVLSDEKLKKILDRLTSFRNIRIIRLGTRAPIVYPKRITPELCRLLSRYDVVWMMVHFNHINEIVKGSISACNLLRKAGLPVLNQTVLLRGVNDCFEALEKLFIKLVEIGVKPYYLYLCDKIPGTTHFWVPLTDVQIILNKLTREISGLALPIFVIVDSKSWKKRIILDENKSIERIISEVNIRRK